MRLDHVQIAIPKGTEDRCRPFWEAAGFAEVDKPRSLQNRGGAWYQAGTAALHLGVDPGFRPATKAHPAFSTPDLDRIARDIDAIGAPVDWDTALEGRRRFFTTDPVGNRIEFMEE